MERNSSQAAAAAAAAPPLCACLYFSTRMALMPPRRCRQQTDRQTHHTHTHTHAYAFMYSIRYPIQARCMVGSAHSLSLSLAQESSAALCTGVVMPAPLSQTHSRVQRPYPRWLLLLCRCCCCCGWAENPRDGCYIPKGNQGTEGGQREKHQICHFSPAFLFCLHATMIACVPRCWKSALQQYSCRRHAHAHTVCRHKFCTYAQATARPRDGV